MQIHTMQYPDGALKATFDNSSIITQVVPTLYGAPVFDPFTGTLLNLAPCWRASPVTTYLSSPVLYCTAMPEPASC